MRRIKMIDRSEPRNRAGCSAQRARHRRNDDATLGEGAKANDNTGSVSSDVPKIQLGQGQDSCIGPATVIILLVMNCSDNWGGSLKNGAIVGRFRIDHLIGKGGMGEVYEATHIDIGRKVALKRLHPEHIGRETMIERFFQEARAAGSVGDDNVCQVEDIVIVDGVPHIIMPLLNGETLADALDREGRLSLSRAVDIARQALSGLDSTHNHSELSIIHRDLKPDNIFLTTVGRQTDFVKILDFGIARVRELGAPSRASSRRKTIDTYLPIGTGPYMAPEQAGALEDIDHRVDIYAIGVILYEMLTGHRPFEGKSFKETIQKVQVDSFLPPHSINSDIPLEIDKVILKAMSRDREDRYASAIEMRYDLERAYAKSGDRTGRPAEDTVRTSIAITDISSRPTRRKRRGSPGARRPRAVRYAVQLLLLMLLAALVFMSFPDTDAEGERTAASRAPDATISEAPVPMAPLSRECLNRALSPATAEPAVIERQERHPTYDGKEPAREKRVKPEARRMKTEESPDTMETVPASSPQTPPEKTLYKEKGRRGSLFLPPEE